MEGDGIEPSQRACTRLSRCTVGRVLCPYAAASLLSRQARGLCAASHLKTQRTSGHQKAPLGAQLPIGAFRARGQKESSVRAVVLRERPHHALRTNAGQVSERWKAHFFRHGCTFRFLGALEISTAHRMPSGSAAAIHGIGSPVASSARARISQRMGRVCHGVVRASTSWVGSVGL